MDKGIKHAGAPTRMAEGKPAAQAGPCPPWTTLLSTSAEFHGGFSTPSTFERGPGSEASRVLFSASRSGSDQGIWTATLPEGKRREKVVDTDASIPGEGGRFTGFTEMSGWADGSVLLVGEGKGSWPDKYHGVFSIARPGAAPKKLVDVRDPFPPLGPPGSRARCRPTFAELGAPLRLPGGGVVFGGADRTSGAVPRDCEGVFLWSADGGVRAVVDSRSSGLFAISGTSATQLPHGAGSSALVFLADAAKEGGAASAPSSAAAEATNQSVHARSTRACPGARCDRRWHQPNALRRSSPGGIVGLYIAHNVTSTLPAAATPQVLLDTSSVVPGAVPRQRFVAFGAPAASGPHVVFLAQGELGVLGVYRLHLTTRELVRVVDTQSLLPAGGGFFFDLPYDPSVRADGEVVFFAAASVTSRSGFYRWGASSLLPVPVATLGEAGFSYMIMRASSFDGQCLAFYGITAGARAGVGREAHALDALVSIGTVS